MEIVGVFFVLRWYHILRDSIRTKPFVTLIAIFLSHSFV